MVVEKRINGTIKIIGKDPLFTGHIVTKSKKRIGVYMSTKLAKERRLI